MARPRKPLSRDEFEIAVVCALPLEYDAVSLVFDGFWDDEGDCYGKAVRDTNSYTTGWVGENNVVLALLPGMGKVNAASAEAAVRLSYTGLKLALLVGVCGGVPRKKGTGGDKDDEILLGDVCISNTVIEWDFGRRYPDGFRRRDTAEYNLERPNKQIRSLLATLQTELGIERLQKRTSFYLRELQSCHARTRGGTKYKYPGVDEDRLFKPDYQHKHHQSECTICNTSSDKQPGPVCDDAITASCNLLQCDETQLVYRKRLDTKRHLEQQGDIAVQDPRVHIGRIASGDSVMKSGEDRDRISKVDGVIAFEMEGAGLWDEVPCLVIKGICDYADSHKSKGWQNFTAAAAASTMKALLERYIRTERPMLNVLERTGALQVRENASPFDISVPQRSHVISGETFMAPDDTSSQSYRSDSSLAHFTVPFDRDPHFVGREEILKNIDRLLSLRLRVAIAGIGGVGKSQIAIEYCHRIHQDNPQCNVFWVPSNTVARLDEACGTIGRILGIPGADEPRANILEIVFNWLNDESHGSWLMVLDNVDDLSMSTEKLSSLMTRTTSKGKFLITTRDTRVGGRLTSGEDCIMVPVLPSEQAESLLLSKLNHPAESSREDITTIAKALDYLPLAITQAAAFVRENHCSPGDYLEALQTRDDSQVELLSQNLPDPRRDAKALSSVVKTWKLSFDLIQKCDPRAAEILSLIAVIDRQGIPKSLLRRDGEESQKFLTALGTLLSFSFIEIETNNQFIAMHPLVHTCMQRWLVMQLQKHRYEAEAVDVLSKKFPDGNHENCTMCAIMLPHVRRVLKCGYTSATRLSFARLCYKSAFFDWSQGRYRTAYQTAEKAYRIRKGLLGETSEATLDCLRTMVLALRDQGKYLEAEALNRQALDGYERLLEKDHISTLTSINDLASVFQDQGKYKEAKVMYQRALDGYKRALGNDHPLTLTCINNLALVLQNMGEYTETEAMNQQVFEGYKMQLGINHPATLTSLKNLASVYKSQGKYAEAEAACREALCGREKVLGKNHPATLISSNDLGSILRDQGKCQEAEVMYRQALEGYVKTLGSDHPFTLTTVFNLGHVLKDQGKYEEAEDMHSRALAGRETTLGKHHPNILASLNSLASVLHSQGRYIESETLSRQALEGYERVLGPDHPDTLASLTTLASTLQKRGLYDQATLLIKRALDGHEKALGKYHPATLANINDLALALKNQGRYKEAEKMYRRALNGRLKVLTRNHPSSLETMNKLASLLKMQGRFREAEGLCREAAKGYKALFGQYHPSTLTSIAGIASVLKMQKKYLEAELLYREALTGYQKSLGGDHPSTLTSLNNLGSVLQDQAKYEDAELMYKQALDGYRKFLGSEHPNTLAIVNNLASLQREQERHTEAKILAENIQKGPEPP